MKNRATLLTILLLTLFGYWSNPVQAQGQVVHSMDFDTDTAFSLTDLQNAGWSYKTNSTGLIYPPHFNLPPVEIYTGTYAISPPNSFRTYISTGAWTYLISPELNEHLSNYQISMSYNGNEQGKLVVGALSDTSNLTTFHPIDTFSVVGTTAADVRVGTVYFSDYDGDAQFIAFKFYFPTGSQHIYIDDIVISLNQNCRPVTDVTIGNVAGSAAQISWTPSISAIDHYSVEYAPVGSTNWISEETYGNNITLTGLTEWTNYQFRIVSFCGSVDDDTELFYFRTECDEFSGKEIAPARNTGGGNLPTGNYHSATQQIFLAEELGGQSLDIDLVAFQFYNTSPFDRNMMVFMKNTSDSTFSTASDWVDTATMQQVFGGMVTLSNRGEDNWTFIKLQNTFQYNGTDNILLCVLDTTGRTYYTSNNYYSHTTTANRSISFTTARDTARIDFNNLPTPVISNNRSNTRFFTCANPTCAMPLFTTITDITENSITLNWLDRSSGGTYSIEYKLATDSTWQRENTGNYPSHTISNLNSGVLYDVRIGKNCTESASSFTAPLRIRTLCGNIAIPYIEDFDSYANAEQPACWITHSGGASTMGITTSTKYEGSASFVIPASTDTFCFAALPLLESEYLTTPLTISFWAKTTDLTGDFSLGFISDVTEIQSFELETTLAFSASNSWKKFDLTFAVPDNMDYHIALLWENGTEPLYIDQFQITQAAACPLPTELTASQIGINQATVSWINERGTGDEWFVTYQVVGDNASVILDTVREPSILLENLLPNSNYMVLITALCGDETSESSAPLYFTTRYATTATPYYCDFEDPLENINWVFVNGSYTNTWNIDTAANNTPNGNNALYISENDGATHEFSRDDVSDVWVYRDIYFDVTTAIYTLSFDWKGRGEINGDDYMKIYIGDTNSIITAGNTTPPANAEQIGGSFYRQETWTTVNFTLPASYQGEMKRLIFYWHNDNSAGYNPPAGVDNIVIVPACYNISGLNVLTTTMDSATISWNRGGAETQWHVEYGIEGFTLGTGTTIVANDTVAVLPNLTHGTLYQVYVAAKCGDDLGEMINTTFSTTCPAITFSDLPYTEDFENWGAGANANFPACWDRVIGNGASAYIVNQSNRNVLKLTTMPDETSIIILPELDNDIDVRTLRMSLSAKALTTDHYLVVGFMEGGLETANFVTYDTLEFPSENWEDFTIRFANYQGIGNRVAVKAPPYFGTYHMDSVTLYHVDDCLSPTAPIVSNIQSGSATISWTPADPSHNRWKVYHKAEDETAYIETERVTPQINLSSLAYNKTYHVKITTLCGSGDESEALVTSFTTSTLYITVVAEAGANGSISPEGTFTVEVNSDTTLTVRPDAGYVIEKVLVNDENVGTDSIVRLTNIRTTMVVKAFFMEDVGIENFDVNLNIYPNPTHNELTVQSDLRFENYTIMNIMGQEIASDVVNDLHFTLNVSNLKPGAYFIRLMNSNGTSVTRKFIKE